MQHIGLEANSARMALWWSAKQGTKLGDDGRASIFVRLYQLANLHFKGCADVQVDVTAGAVMAGEEAVQTCYPCYLSIRAIE